MKGVARCGDRCPSGARSHTSQSVQVARGALVRITHLVLVLGCWRDLRTHEAEQFRTVVDRNILEQVGKTEPGRIAPFSADPDGEMMLGA